MSGRPEAPLPSPRQDESEDEFIDRCMADDTMNEEYPDESQRRAVCQKQWDGEEEGMMESRVLEMALDTQWAMTEPGLRQLITVVDTWLGADVTLELPAPEEEDEAYDPDAVSTRTGEPIDGARAARIRDGVAVVPVVGPIFRRGNLITKVSAATSIEVLARDLRAAVEEPAAEAVLLDVDSPGGEVNGISEMSDLIFEARSEKPVRAFVSGAGASGGYWLASAAERVDAADTALLGSIGVRTAFVDRSERNRSEGIRRIEFVSSQTPNKVPDPTAEEGREQIQSVIDAMADVFIDDVARNRGVSRETVLEDFGAGAVFVGEEAVRRGLADGVSTFEQVLEEMRTERTDAGVSLTPAADQLNREDDVSDSEDQTTREQLSDINASAEDLRAACPGAVEEIEEEAASEAAEAERERIQAIYDLDVPSAYDDLKGEAMFDPEATANTVSRRILDRQSERKRAQLEAREGDEEELDAPSGSATAAGADEEGAEEAAAILGAARKAGTLQPVAATEA